MNHEIAGGEVGEGLEFLAVGVLFQLQLFLCGGGELALGEHGQLQRRPLAPGGQRPHGDSQLAGPGHGGALEVKDRRDAPFLQKPQQILRPHLAAAEHQHGGAGIAVMLQIADRRFKAAAIGAELPGAESQQPLGL